MDPQASHFPGMPAVATTVQLLALTVHPAYTHPRSPGGLLLQLTSFVVYKKGFPVPDFTYSALLPTSRSNWHDFNISIPSFSCSALAASRGSEEQSYAANPAPLPHHVLMPLSSHPLQVNKHRA